MRHGLHCAHAMRRRLVRRQRQRGRVHAVRRWALPRQHRRDGLRAVHCGRRLSCRVGGSDAVRGWQLLEQHGQHRAGRLRHVHGGELLRRRLHRAVRLCDGQVQRRVGCHGVQPVRGWHLPGRRGQHGVCRLHAGRVLRGWGVGGQAVRCWLLWQSHWSHVAGGLRRLPSRQRLLPGFDSSHGMCSRLHRRPRRRIRVRCMCRWHVSGQRRCHYLRRLHTGWLLP